MSAWDEQRPIFKRLPQYGWQDNEAADWITAAYDAVLIELQQAILNFPRDFIDPDTARSDALDWLAQLMGYTGDYWDTTWNDAIKRQLIKDAQPIVWRYKGSYYLLEYLFELFGLEVQIKLQGQWTIGVSKVGDAIGGPLMVYSLVIGDETNPGYIRASQEWRLIERLNRLYMPCWCAPVTTNGSYLHYHRWRVSMSMVGEPI
jgi:phage tail P2-like protein